MPGIVCSRSERIFEQRQFHAAEDFGVQFFYLLFQTSQVAQTTANNEPQMIAHPVPIQCMDKLRYFSLSGPKSQLSNLLRRCLSGKERQ